MKNTVTGAARRKAPLTLALFCWAALPADARAQDARAQGASAGAEPLRAVAAVGAVQQLLEYQEAYGATGVAIAGGVDAPLFGTGAHRVRLLGHGVAFPAGGAELYFGSFDAGWRWYPFECAPLHVGATTGALLSYERFAIKLPAAGFDESLVRFGVPLALNAGWTFFRRLDVEVSYRQIVYPTGAPATIGWAQAMVGWRL